MSLKASQITGVSIVCSAVRSGTDQRKHHLKLYIADQWKHKGPVTRKMFPFDVVVMQAVRFMVYIIVFGSFRGIGCHFLCPSNVSVQHVRSNVTFTISYLLYLIRQFAEWEAYLYDRKRADLNVKTFILPLYTMIIIKIQSKKLWMWQLWMWRGRTLDGHTSHSQNSNVSIDISPVNIALWV